MDSTRAQSSRYHLGIGDRDDTGIPSRSQSVASLRWWSDWYCMGELHCMGRAFTSRCTSPDNFESNFHDLWTLVNPIQPRAPPRVYTGLALTTGHPPIDPFTTSHFDFWRVIYSLGRSTNPQATVYSLPRCSTLHLTSPSGSLYYVLNYSLLRTLPSLELLPQ